MTLPSFKGSLSSIITAGIGACCLFLTCSHIPSAPPENQAPYFSHLPVFSVGGDTIVVAHAYRDTLYASDPDSDAIIFSCSGCPASMAFTGGKLSWTPTEPETGGLAFQIAIKDSKGAGDSIYLRYMVKDTNRAPRIIVDTARFVARVGHLFTDTIHTVDPDRNTVILTLTSAPDSMQVNTNILRWIPQEVDTGEDTFFVHANDGKGGYDTIKLTISVIDTNHEPVFITQDSILNDTVIVGQTYSDTIPVRDPENDSLEIGMFRHPAGMTLVDSVVSWSPTVADTGIHAIHLQICDTSGLCARLDWSIMVLDSNHAPIFVSDSLDMKNAAPVGRLMRDTVHAIDPDKDSLSFFLGDSSSRIILHDSILTWTPVIADTPGKTISVYVSDNQGKYDSLTWHIAVSDTNHWPQFITTASMLNDTLAMGDTFVKTFTASDFEDDSLEFRFIDSAAGIIRSADSLFWLPALADTGWQRFALVVTDHFGGSDTLVWHVLVNAWPTACPSYTHKNDVRLGTPQSLDPGYYLYVLNGRNGLYKSHFYPYNPKVIPGTTTDLPSSMEISDDGQWIIYCDKRTYRPIILNQSGKHKTVIPFPDIDIGYPRVMGFLRDSPIGPEIWYFANELTMRAMRVYFEPDTVFFGATRTLVDLNNSDTVWSMAIDPLVDFGVVRNKIFGRFLNWATGTMCSRSDFFTIPDDGRGVATAKDRFHWKDDDFITLYGCGHQLSQDGQYALENTPYNISSRECVPTDHDGFVITPFRLSTDPPISYYHEHLEVYGTSLNWCPEQYRPSSDFWGWYFSNNNRFVIGRDLKPGSTANGVWMVEWPTNTWTRLTPSDSMIQSYETACYFGIIQFDSTDTAHQDTSTHITPPDPFDPKYQVIRPNGGEVFHTGDQCTVSVAAAKNSDANVYLVLPSGRYEFLLPGLTNSINPFVDSLLTFTIPDSFPFIYYNSQLHRQDTTWIQAVSDSCEILIRDYNAQARYEDRSDGYFRIIP